MLRIGRYRVAIEAVLVGLALLLVMAYCTKPAPDTEMERLQEERVRVALAYSHQRRTTDSVITKSMVATRAAMRSDAARRKAEATLEGMLAANDSLLSDTSATVAMLKLALAQSTEHTRMYIQRVQVYADSVNALMTAHTVERHAFRASLAYADSVIRADSLVIRGLTERNQCRILWVRCPSRPQSFTAGLLLGTLTILVL